MWVVMTSRKCMPASCKSFYTRVAIVKLDQYMTARDLRPAMISNRARGVLRLRDFGYFPASGKTMKSGLQQALAAARRACDELNNAAPIAEGDLLLSYGSA